MPVMKSEVMNVLMTTDLWQEGIRGRCWGSRLKCKGSRITGIWLTQWRESKWWGLKVGKVKVQARGVGPPASGRESKWEVKGR